MTLPAPAAVPPTALPGDVDEHAVAAVAQRAAPVASVPMKLPLHRGPAEGDAGRRKTLPEMTLPAPAAVPPTVVSGAPDEHAVAVAQRGGSRRRRCR